MIDFSNITLGTLQVQSVSLGNIHIWPSTAPYVFNCTTENPMNIASGGFATLFTIKIESYHGASPLQPTYAIDELNEIEAVFEGMSRSGNVYSFTFSCTSNPSSFIRMTDIIFTQPESSNVISVTIRQARGRS